MTAYEGAREAIRRHRECCNRCRPLQDQGGFQCSEGERLERAARRIYRESLSQGGLFEGPLFDGERGES